MIQKVVSMDTKLQAMYAYGLGGQPPVSVTALCEELGISRQTFYKYRRRFAEHGAAGLVEVSRRPVRSPGQTPAEVQDAILVARKQLAEEGWDNGAISIRYRLLADGVPAPSARTVHRVLTRLGLVVPAPQKRPRSALRRFVFPATDDCWQIDAFEMPLADGTPVVVFQLLDDHSRFDLADLAWPVENGAGAWACASTAISRYGQPRMLLSDNGLAFSGARRGKRAVFEQNLRALGVLPITSRPYHPQTCGKNERAHHTVRQWLAARGAPATLTELQRLVDTYRDAYNNDRPHQALKGQTPAEARAAGIRVTPNPVTVTYPMITKRVVVDKRGNTHALGAIIAVGSENVGLTLDAFITGNHVLLFHHDRLVRDLTVDPTKQFQPMHRSPLRPGTRLPRIADTSDIDAKNPDRPDTST